MQNDEKEKSGWQVTDSEYLFRRPWLTVRRDCLRLPNGNEIPEYYVLEYPDWVNVLAVTPDQKFVFVRQYRHGLGLTAFELCAGVCEKEDSSPLESAQRELWEETGYGNGTWQEYMVLSAKSQCHEQPDPLLPGYRSRTGFDPAPRTDRRSYRTLALPRRSQNLAARRCHQTSVTRCLAVEIHGGKQAVVIAWSIPLRLPASNGGKQLNTLGTHKPIATRTTKKRP